MDLRSMNQFSMDFRSMDFRSMDFRSMNYHGAVIAYVPKKFSMVKTLLSA
jgi:hypothetical protein